MGLRINPEEEKRLAQQAAMDSPESPFGVSRAQMDAWKQEKDDADKQNRLMAGMASIADNLGSAQGWGNFFLGSQNETNRSSSALAEKLAKKVEDPQARYSKLLSNYRAAQEGKMGDIELKAKEARMAPGMAAVSQKRYSDALNSVGIQYDPEDIKTMSLDDLEGRYGKLNDLTMKGADWKRKDRELDLKGEENRIAKESKPGDRSVDLEIGLRKEYDGDEVVKKYKNVRVARDKIVAAASSPSAAGDLSLIYGYNTILDPSSSVKEGEVANAENAKGWSDEARSLYNKALTGAKLTPEQRKDFVNQAQKLYGAHEAAYNEKRKYFSRLAEEYGVNPSRVAFEYAPTVTPSAKQTPTKQTAKPSLINEANAADVPTMVRDGVTYRKVPGGWESVD